MFYFIKDLISFVTLKSATELWNDEYRLRKKYYDKRTRNLINLCYKQARYEASLGNKKTVVCFDEYISKETEEKVTKALYNLGFIRIKWDYEDDDDAFFLDEDNHCCLTFYFPVEVKR